jgi:histone H3/H4
MSLEREVRDLISQYGTKRFLEAAADAYSECSEDYLIQLRSDLSYALRRYDGRYDGTTKEERDVSGGP